MFVEVKLAVTAGAMPPISTAVPSALTDELPVASVFRLTTPELVLESQAVAGSSIADYCCLARKAVVGSETLAAHFPAASDPFDFS